MEQFTEGKLYKIVKENMQRLRKQKKLTQAEVAKKIGVTVQHYQQMETGSTAPNLRMIYKLCNAFNVHPGYFFAEEDLSIVDRDGNVLIDNLSSEDIEALKNASHLSPEAKRSILEYIKYTQYREENEIKQ